MEISSLIPHIESLIFASDKPLTPAELTELINQAFGFMEDKVLEEQVQAALEGIVEKYSSEFYPFEVRMSGGGWQFLTKKEFHKTVAQLNGEKFLKRLSAAALETLAIIAYKQPITKGEIEAIRGVSSDYSVQKLLEKELIIISGRNEKMPGHPLVYATSKGFMDYFGINSAEDLPKIKEVLADQVVQGTLVNPEDFQTSGLLVTDDGELIEEQGMTGSTAEAGPVQTIVNGRVVDPETGEVTGAAQEEAGEDDVAGGDEPADSNDDSDAEPGMEEETELSEADFPEEEQEEIRIGETSDEIEFTPDELDESAGDSARSASQEEDPLADDDSPSDKDTPDAP
ncbi:SMC-Scp complex subunit ScpB [Flaviaesturariibacter flavus]|uniref:SMC-Scp complex subunit ScpB n=1 Tax=Flaviaesturariibacter flavus TaxID=2502780 RepID=A0A4R1BM96_9BACT|nr:SMC-Scp complex subunit ScpB [Flaviaesturariibacter flavus]TCJ18601.1 SMC-Scp complex subunit ScpB [Flaviaesturariibacter flavus]